jgi:hypothetical protein
MTRACCPSCRLRFSRAVAAYLVACPQCDAPLERVSSAERVVGFRLAGDVEDSLHGLPEAIAAALPIIPPNEEPSP